MARRAILRSRNRSCPAPRCSALPMAAPNPQPRSSQRTVARSRHHSPCHSSTAGESHDEGNATVSEAARRERPLFCAGTKTGRPTGAAPSDKVVACLVKGAAQRAGLATAAGAALPDLNTPEPNKIVVQRAPAGQFAMRFIRNSSSCGLPGTNIRVGVGNRVDAEILSKACGLPGSRMIFTREDV